MISEKQKILNWLYRQEFPSGVLEFDSYLIDAAEKGLGKSRIEAEAYTEVNRKRYWEYLVKLIEEDELHGLTPLFRVIHYNSRRMVWCARDYEINSSAKQRARIANLQSRPAILNKIDTLNDRQYEALGGVISRLIGANAVSLTPRGNEGGIDFFASLYVYGSSHIFSGISSPVRVIGQSKKYKNPVQVDKVKEFIQTIQDVKNYREEIRKHVPAWFRAARGPIVGWIIAHSGFQSGAESRAKTDGIVLSDSTDLAEIAALSRQLARNHPAKHRALHLENMVKAILNEHL